jgi:hypothetical protein
MRVGGDALLGLDRDKVITILHADSLPFAPAGQDLTGERWGSSIWTKLQAFALVHFSNFVFLDADSLLLHNVDELFSLDADFAGVGNAAGDVHPTGSCWMTAAMWVGVGSAAIYRSMLDWLQMHDKFVFAEQFFLPIFLDGSFRLPAFYSCQFPAGASRPSHRARADPAPGGTDHQRPALPRDKGVRLG